MESTSDGWMDYSQTFHDSWRRTDEELSLEVSLEVSRQHGVSVSVLQNRAGLLQTLLVPADRNRFNWIVKELTGAGGVIFSWRRSGGNGGVGGRRGIRVEREPPDRPFLQNQTPPQKMSHFSISPF